MTNVEVGDNIIHSGEHMTIGILPDVLFDRNGGYHKMTKDDVNLGKFNIGNTYYNTSMDKNVTLMEDITYKSGMTGDIMIKTSFGCDNTTNSSLKYLTPVKRRFNIGDTVDVRAALGAPSGTGEIVGMWGNNSYEIRYDGNTWSTHDDYISLHVKPEVIHKFNVGDHVKFDTFVSGTGVIIEYDKRDDTYRIETDDKPEGYSKVWSHSTKVTKVVTKELNTGDKLTFGNWKLEVVSDELMITNVFPDDVIKLDVTSNGWIRNSKNKTVHNW